MKKMTQVVRKAIEGKLRRPRVGQQDVVLIVVIGAML